VIISGLRSDRTLTLRLLVGAEGDMKLPSRNRRDSVLEWNKIIYNIPRVTPRCVLAAGASVPSGKDRTERRARRLIAPISSPSLANERCPWKVDDSACGIEFRDAQKCFVIVFS
jgi:hypothetical protein